MDTTNALTRGILSTVWVRRGLVFIFFGLAIYGLVAVPARRYLDQRSEAADRHSQLSDIQSKNSDLKSKIRRLDDPDEIQRIARRDYGLVTEGEESYTILPSATAGLNLPASWPFDLLSEPVKRVSAGGG